MKNIKIFGSGIYLPKNEVNNKVLADKFGVDEEFIYKRTGISKRYYIENETIQKLAINATKNLFSKLNFNKDDVGMIVVATTSSDRLMPGISYLVQKELDIDNCMCFDILAGCSGYINAFDIARTYISIGKVKYALVIGAEILSRYTNKDDLGTAIILSDGAGATLIGEDEKELSKIASGGEMSRIMLAIKTVLANTDKTPIMIFDEIDTGISGKAAKSVGQKLKLIGNNHQVICITHQPSIAAKGDQNYFISKSTSEGRTHTKIKQLDENEIIDEIARISNGDITDIARKHAVELRKSA